MNTTNGKEHDFSLYKRSKLSILKKKNTKNNKLTDYDKIDNQIKASKRIFVEHINAKVKTFKLLNF